MEFSTPVATVFLLVTSQCFFFTDIAASAINNSKKEQFTRQRRSYDDTHAKVLILGAGAAGLHAAKYLHKNGMDDFIVIEGADYIGGRVRDVSFAGVKVELGANWAHPGGTDITKQVQRLGMEFHVSDWDSLVMIDKEGKDVTSEAEDTWDQLNEAADKTQEIAEDIVDNDEPDMSIRAALRLSGWSPKTSIDHVIEWFRYDFEWADIPAVTSLRSTASLNAVDDEDLFITDQRGYKYIFNDIIGFMQNDSLLNHIRLNQTVVSIGRGDDDVNVTCSDGTIYTADYALVTFGLGIMQAGTVTFNPPLPDWKIQELYKFIMTSFTKIFLKWPYKFWGDEEWLIHVNDRCGGGYYPSFLNLEAEGLFPSGTNILVAFVTGEQSRRVENQPDADTKAEIEQVLRGMYGEQAVPDAEEMLISGWNRNPFHRGAYSNWPVEVSVDCFKKIESSVGRLFFGGEHTDEMYNGYILGAQRSGEREAKKLLQCLNSKCSKPVYSVASKLNSSITFRIFIVIAITTTVAYL